MPSSDDRREHIYENWNGFRWDPMSQDEIDAIEENNGITPPEYDPEKRDQDNQKNYDS